MFNLSIYFVFVVCFRDALMLNKGVIFCPCGLRINTEVSILQ